MTTDEKIFRWAHPVQFWQQYAAEDPCGCQTCVRLRELIHVAVAEAVAARDAEWSKAMGFA